MSPFGEGGGPHPDEVMSIGGKIFTKVTTPEGRAKIVDAAGNEVSLEKGIGNVIEARGDRYIIVKSSEGVAKILDPEGKEVKIEDLPAE